MAKKKPTKKAIKSVNGKSIEDWDKDWVRVPGGFRDLQSELSVRRQDIWLNLRRKLAECGRRPGVDVKRRACGVASADVRLFVA